MQIQKWGFVTVWSCHWATLPRSRGDCKKTMIRIVPESHLCFGFVQSQAKRRRFEIGSGMPVVGKFRRVFGIEIVCFGDPSLFFPFAFAVFHHSDCFLSNKKNKKMEKKEEEKVGYPCLLPGSGQCGGTLFKSNDERRKHMINEHGIDYGDFLTKDFKFRIVDADMLYVGVPIFTINILSDEMEEKTIVDALDRDIGTVPRESHYKDERETVFPMRAGDIRENEILHVEPKLIITHIDNMAPDDGDDAGNFFGQASAHPPDERPRLQARARVFNHVQETKNIEEANITCLRVNRTAHDMKMEEEFRPFKIYRFVLCKPPVNGDLLTLRTYDSVKEPVGQSSRDKMYAHAMDQMRFMAMRFKNVGLVPSYASAGVKLQLPKPPARYEPGETINTS